MALEAATYISDLVATNPTGADAKSTADDHLRLIKAAVKATFPNVAGPVTVTQSQINDVVNKAPLASPALTGVPTAPTATLGTNTTQLASTAFVQAAIATIEADSASSATASQNSAIAAAASAGAAPWYNTGATYAVGDVRYSLLSGRIYRRLTASNAGTTDPSIDFTNWKSASTELQITPVTARSIQAVPNNHYELKNAGTSDTNLLLYSQDFSNAAWDQNGCYTSITANAALAPDGTVTASKLVRNTSDTGDWSELLLEVAVGAGNNVGKTYTATVWLWTDAGTTAAVICISDVDYNNHTTNVVITTTPKLFTFTTSGGAGWNPAGIKIGFGLNQTKNTTVYAWGAQLEPSATPSAYIPTTSSAVTVTRGPQLRLPSGAAKGDVVKTTWTNGLYTSLIQPPQNPNLVVNGDFIDGTTTGWAVSSSYAATASASTGEFVVTATAAFGRWLQGVPTVVGRTYQISAYCRFISGGGSAVFGITNSLGGDIAVQFTVSGSAVLLTQSYTAVSTTTYISAGHTTNGAVAGFDNITVTEVNPIAGFAGDLTLDTSGQGSVDLQLMDDGVWRLV